MAVLEERLSRRRFLRRVAVLAAGLAAGASVLAACGPTPAPTATPAPKKEVATPKPAEKIVEKPVSPAVKEQVVLQFHMRAGTEKSEAPLYVTRPKEFMEQYPHIKVELSPIPGPPEYWTKVETLLLAKTLGDVMWTNDLNCEHSRLVQLGAILPIDDYMKAYGHSKDEWIPGAMDTLTYDGKLYGLPKNSHPGECYIWINHELFKAAGIAIPPTYGNTHDQIVDWALKLSKGPADSREVWGYYTRVKNLQAYAGGVRCFGGFELSQDGTKALCDSEPWSKWASWNYDIYHKHKVSSLAATLPGGEAALATLFAEGKVAMVHQQRATQAQIKATVKDKFAWSTIQYPRYSDSKPWGACVATHSATTTSKHPDEAFLLSYAMADDRMSYLSANEQSYLTARSKELEKIGPAAQDPFIQLQYKCQIEESPYHRPKNLRGSELEKTIDNELDKVWTGKEKVTPEFMKALNKAVQEVLDKRPL